MSGPDRRQAMQVATTVTIVVAFVFVALRMISRISITRRTTLDDYMMIIAWIIAFGGSLTILLAARKGLGLMDAELKPEWLSPLKKFGYIYSILYNLALMATKTSILIFYLRLSRTNKLFWIGTYTTMGVVNVVGLVLTFVNIFQCHPLDKIFSESFIDPSQKCIPLVTLFLASSPSNVITDLAILVLPIPVLTGMHLPTRQKTILVLTFGLGIFVTVVDVIRIYYLQQALGITTPNSSSPQVTPGLGASPNFVFNVSYGLMWSIVEVNIGIICGCIPLLKPLISKTMPKLINPPGFHSSQKSPNISATLTRPEEMPTLPRPAAQNNIEGLTLLNFRMSATPLPEMSMTPAPNLGTPILQNSHRTSVSPIGGMGEAPSQLASRRVSFSPVQEGGSFLQQPSQEPSLEPSQETLILPALESSTPIEQTETSTSLSAEHESYSPRRRFPQQTALSQQNDAEDQVQNHAQPAQEGFLSPEQQQHQEMDMLNSLTSPGMANPPRSGSSPDQPNELHFGFVKICQPRSMLRTSVKDSWKYCSWISASFFLLGFSYGLLNTLNVQISVVARYTQALTVSLHTMYFAGYFFGPLTVGLYCLKKGGFKVTFMVGLCIFGTGTLIFWPSSILITYPGFIISNFIIGFGLSVFETVANPFVILCGPPRYGESRLLAVQFVRSIGAIVSELLVEKAFSPSNEVHNNIHNIRWTYLAISFITVIVALVFHYMPLPEASDEGLQNSLQTRLLPLNRTVNDDPGNRIFGCRVVYVSLTLACFAMFSYMFNQEGFNVWFNSSFLSAIPGRNGAHRRQLLSPNFVLIGHCAFSGSLLLAAVLCLYVRPRFILLGAFLSSAAIKLWFTLIPSELEKDNSAKIAGLAIAEYFCEGPVYAIILGLALRGLGAKTKLGAALVITMNVGGAAGPWVVLGITKGMKDTRRLFIAGVVLLFTATLYPLYLCVVPKARDIVDWHDDGVGESERRRSQSDSIAAVEGHGMHWPVLVEKEFAHIKRASATSGKAVSKWAGSVRDWTRRVSGLGKEAVPREFA
ncbi:hypothetical protein VC83_08477 [Pseudogymnoascus destructans]|uniref:Rhodopsin domain-containing protein n=2 Tax=Pseudogymnoascus destructans TaxID=655981 RepID=L8FRH7_PSED2|nr:uncharacterized protein VC83_08477 [Pseudogymnoascus destructans]ELR03139.1 hypothetical protein GMDG_05968 [Pseudogymnoascus destructans 20631-21]OAF55167.1 hypothetical protein VC83_08477 [Pseudogymnoascus destructans]